jgi:hypothetical protein
LKKTVYKVKPNALGTLADVPRERAMSTFIQRKSPPMIEQNLLTKRSASRGVLGIQKISANAG